MCQLLSDTDIEELRAEDRTIDNAIEEALLSFVLENEFADTDEYYSACDNCNERFVSDWNRF